jgi:hypothetical protein
MVFTVKLTLNPKLVLVTPGGTEKIGYFGVPNSAAKAYELANATSSFGASGQGSFSYGLKRALCTFAPLSKYLENVFEITSILY